MTVALVGAAALLGPVAACRRAAAPPLVAVVAIPDRKNQTPNLVADGDVAIVAWTAVQADGTADAYAAVSRDGGITFGSPVRVNDVAGEVRTSEQQAPRVAMRGRTVAVVWTAKRDGVTRVRLARSMDEGRSFAASQSISPAGAPGTRGWASLLIDEQQRVHVLWLDTRVAATESSMPSMSASVGAGAYAAMGATRQDVYAAVLARDGRLSEHLVATNVCFCCKTAIGQTAAGVWAAWRDVYPGNLRDISFTSLDDRADAQRVRVSQDGWQLDGCPEDGPAMAAAADGRIDLVWPTLVSNAPLSKGIFSASTTDGRAFSTRVRIDSGTGSASHPGLAVTTAGTVAAVWERVSDSTHRIELRQRQGTEWLSPTVLTEGATAASPAIAASGRDFIVAWERRDGPHSRIEVQRARSGIR